ncbi:MAG: SBBP repeat-containing protein [Tepidisphaeraceae bacterium]
MPQRPLPRKETRLDSLEARRLLSFSGGTPATLVGEGYESIDRVLALSDGGYVAAGLFRKTKFTDKGKLRSSADQSDAYVTRVGPDGAVMWTRVFASDWETKLQQRTKSGDLIDFPSNPARAGEPFVLGTSDQPQQPGEIITGLAEAPDGSIVIGGAFLGKINLDVATFETSDDFYDGFVARLNGATGATNRAFTIAGDFNDVVTDVKVDSVGSVIVAGSFERHTDFNPGKAKYIVDPKGRGDGFIAKFSANDKLVWLTPIGSDSVERSEVEAVNSIALDAAGNVYATGTFAYITDFDPGKGVSEVRADGITDSFTAKYNADGSLGWARTQGGDRFDGGRVVAVASNGQVYSAGYFQRDVKLNPDAPSVNFSEISDRDGRTGNRDDVFFTSFNSDGSVRWVRQLGGKDYDLVSGIAVDNSGNVVLSGSFTDTVDFDPSKRRLALTSPQGDNIPDANTGDRDRAYSGFVATYSPRGYLVNAKQIDGKFGQDLFASGMSLGSDGRLVVAGRFLGGITSPQIDGLDITISTKPRGREDGFLIQVIDGAV